MREKINIGDKFYKLTVLDNSVKQHNFKLKGIINLVECECGNQFKTPSTYLRIGRVKSCTNCSFKNREISRKQVSQIEQLFKRLVLDRCKKNDIEVSITSEDYEKIGKQKCYYCDDIPQKTNRFSNRKYVNTEELYINGLDRLDINKGYILDNCVPCCTSCNYAKHILSKEEFMKKIIKIYNNLNLSKW